MAQTFSKTVNALIPDARMTSWAKVLVGWAVYPTIRYHGGLWVGGSLTIADGAVRFTPNALNRVFHAGDVSFAVPLAQIRSVRVEQAMATNIVVMTTVDGERRVRGYDAEGIAAAIDTAKAQAA